MGWHQCYSKMGVDFLVTRSLHISNNYHFTQRRVHHLWATNTPKCRSPCDLGILRLPSVFVAPIRSTPSLIRCVSTQMERRFKHHWMGPVLFKMQHTYVATRIDFWSLKTWISVNTTTTLQRVIVISLKKIWAKTSLDLWLRHYISRSIFWGCPKMSCQHSFHRFWNNPTFLISRQAGN